MTKLKEANFPQLKRLNMDKKTLESMRKIAASEILKEAKKTKPESLKLPKLKTIKSFKSGDVKLKSKSVKSKVSATQKPRTR